MAAIEKYEDARSAMTNGSGYTAALSSLQTAYDNLLAEYNEKILAVRKETLAALVEATAPLIGQVGTLEFATLTPLKLTAENLYCNEVRADDCASNGANADNSAIGYVKNLTDGNNDTFLHTNYNNAVAVNPPHYLRVDLGENSAVKNFSFNYVTRNNGNNCPTTIVVEGCDTPDGTYTEIRTLTDGLPNGSSLSFDSGVITSSVAYRYIRIKVTGVEGGGATFFVMAEFGFSIMGENNISVKDRYAAVVSEDLLLSIYSVNEASKTMCESTVGLTMEMLDTQIAEQTAAKKNLEDAIASLTIDKTALQELYNDALALYNEMADANGAIRAEYVPSALTVEMLSSAKTALDTALAQLNDENTSQDAVDAAKVALQAKYDELLGIEEANLNEDGRAGLDSKIAEIEAFLATIATENEGEYTLNSYFANVNDLGFNELCNALQQAKGLYSRFYLTQAQCDKAIGGLNTCLAAIQSVVDADCKDRTALTTAINNANTLLDAIAAKGEGYYSTAIGLGIDELRTALQNAESVISSSYLTTEQYNTLLSKLNQCYATTNGVVALDCNNENRNNLSTLIGNVNTLLSTIAVEGETTVALPLQTTNANADFYIKLSAVGDGNVANLIDKNADGGSNINTYVGSAWGGAIADYTHYVQVDLGADCSLDKFSFDYATRNSGHDTERPVKIKILGSNNGTDFTEVTVIEEGLATGAGERSALLSVELGKHYRYVRFAVKSGVNSFHMSDFNLYAVLDYTLKEYYTTAEGLGFVELCMALQSAENAAAHYMTSDKFDNVKTMLDGYYTTTQGVVDLDYKERGELETLIDDTQALIDEVATVTEVETPTLSTANVYCNADNSTNANAGEGDKLGVSVLFDGNVNTHLHTTFGDNVQDDDLDHYIRVDMGAGKAVQNFSFNYIGRSSSSNNDPKEIVVQACNTVDGDWVTVKTLTGLPTDGDAVEYTSPVIEMNEPYRFVRLMVTDTQNSKTTSYNGISHKFFVMSEFGFTTYPTVVVKEEYQNVTSHTVLDAYMEKNSAAEANDHYMLAADYTETFAGLQAAYDALNHEKELCSLPVKLTTDANNPVLYKIKVKSNEKVFTYDGQSGDASKNPILSVDALGNKYQAWYFMQGNNEDSNDDILILPYYHEGALNTTHKLGYPNINGSTKPVVSESGASSYNWYITFTEDKTTEGWWNLQPQGGTSDNTFVNQQGGSSSTILSFWKSANNPGDNGSQFQFVLDETDYSLSDAYFALYNEWAAADTEVTYGPKIGTFSKESVDAYYAAYSTAAALLEAKNAADADYDNARIALGEKYDAIEYNAGMCRIKSAFTGGNGYSIGKAIYVNAENKLCFEKATDENLSKYVWEFVPVKGGYNIKSLHTQSSVVSATTWGGQVALGDEADARLVTIDFLAEDIVRLNVSGGHPLHAQQQGSVVVHYPGEKESASAWYLEEITDDVAKVNVKHTVSLGADEITAKAYSTLYLAYNAQIPSGVTASIVTGINEIGQLETTPVEGGILPANTAVVLSGANAGNVDFKYTANEADFNPQGNILKGTSCNKLVECGDAYNVYMLGKNSGRVAFYWAYENRGADGNYVYINANKEIVESTAAGAHKNHNKGGYVKCNANKAYLLDEENPDQAAAAMYSFFFGGETTDLDEANCENGEVKTIYDLQGRKLLKVTSPGLYIVNGKKVYVTEIEE